MAESSLNPFDPSKGERSKNLINPPKAKIRTVTFDPPETKLKYIMNKQTLAELHDLHGFLDIEICNPQANGRARNRYIDYEVKMKTDMSSFKLKECSVRRRYKDFLWLKKELERDTKIAMPPLPRRSLIRRLPFLRPGLFDADFIEHRRKGLEEFINLIARHPLAKNEKCLHMFLQDLTIDRSYTPGKLREKK